MRRFWIGLVGAAGLLAVSQALQGQGHGPIYGLSTPTLGDDGWSVDLAAMSRRNGDRWMAMLRPILSYGITEDVQASLSLPMPLYLPEGARPARATTRMPATRDVEVLLGWRFHRRGTDIGTRFETTTYVGFDYPTDAVRAGTRTAPGLVGALVTGYASRAVYVWAGGLYRRYMTSVGATRCAEAHSRHTGDRRGTHPGVT